LRTEIIQNSKKRGNLTTDFTDFTDFGGKNGGQFVKLWGLDKIGKKKGGKNERKCALLSKNEAKIRKNVRFLSKIW